MLFIDVTDNNLSVAESLMRNLILSLVVVTCLFSIANAVVLPQGQNNPVDDGVLIAPGVLVIKFAPEVDLQSFSTKNANPSTGIYDIDNIFIENNVNNLEKLFVGSERTDKVGSENMARYYRIEFPPEINPEEFAEKLKITYGIEDAEKVTMHRLDVNPNDGSFSSQWHHYNAGDHDIDTPQAWDITTGDSTVIVAIADTGVQWNHPDLGGSSPYTNGNIWINWAEMNGTDGVDDDGNGYIDDYRGWDWVSVTGAWSGEDATTPDNNPMDFNGHGTHCAGIAAAITNNSYGVAGVAGGFYPDEPGVKIMCLRIGWSAPHPTYGYEVGYVRMDFAAQAYYYATNNGADVISCSWGSSNSSGLGAALTYALSNNVIICTSAGNDGSTSADYLNSQSAVISVASTTSSDSKSSFSNYGTWVDISAPGSNIYSTYSNHGSASFAALSGTSMSCPMVAGLAALIKTRDTNLSRDDVKNIMFNAAENIDAENPSYIGLLGAGRINAFESVNQIAYASFEGTPRIGLPPLEVEFTGDCPFQVNSWKYYFGDGDSSEVQNPTHTYTEPGAYDLDLLVSTTLGEVEQTENNYIYVLADTLKVMGYEGPTSETNIEIPVRLTNYGPVNEIIIPITFAGPLNLTYQNFTVAGTRCEYFEKAQLVSYNSSLKACVFRLKANDGGSAQPLSPGEGEVMRLQFGLSSAAEGTNSIDTLTVSGYDLGISTHVGDYVPVFTTEAVTISNGNRGDANGDGDLNVSDAVFLINYVFSPGSPEPASQCGGDANNDDLINLSDAVFIINYVFSQGSPAPAPCF